MSRTIDEKIVSMQFDNRNFESNVRDTMTSIENLNKSLKFDNAGKGLENVNAAISKCNFAPLNGAIETVGVKFNALYTIADQTLRNITNSAYNAGKNIVSALTIDPVKTGFSEYETQINAVQTILANTESKGSTLNDVNAALDELNTYADKTIYNFTEMTNNIGKFTAAGVDLETSVSAIQGIANLAAVSGSTSQQASTAMYQLSQALAAGKVSLMDWNSVVNAGMGGELFQNALIRTSELLKTGAKDAIDTYGTFRESLTKGEWLTTEVLTETLKQLSGAYTEADLVAQGYTEEQAAEITKLAETATNAATKVKTATQLWDTLKEAAQSGWTQTWEILVGDFEEARKMWTGVSDTIGEIIGESANKRNTLLSGALDTNWEKFIAGINEAGIETEKFEERVRKLAESKGIDFSALLEQCGSFEEVFRSGAASSDLLKEALGGVSETLEKTQEYTVKAGDSLWAIAKQYGMTAGELAKLNDMDISDVIHPGDVLKIGTALEETAASAQTVSDETLGLIDNLDKLGGRELLVESFANVFESLKYVIGPVKEAFDEITKVDPKQLYDLIEKFHGVTEKTTEVLSGAFDNNWTKFIKGVNEAGIETGKFEEKVKNLAESKGLDFAAIVEEYGSFEKTLRSGAISSDILREALDGVDEKTLGLIDNLDKLGGRELVVESLVNIFEGLKSAITPIKEAFGEIFDFEFNIESNQIYDIIEKFHSLTEKFKLSDTQAEQLKTTFKGLFSVIRMGIDFVGAIVSGVWKLAGNLTALGGLGGSILEITSSIGEFFINLRNSAKETDIFAKAVDKVVIVIQSVIDWFKKLAGALKIRFSAPGLEGFAAFLVGVWNVIRRVGSAIAEAGRAIGEGLMNIFQTGDLNAGLDILNSGLLATILLGVKKFINGLTETLDVKGGFIESLTALRDGVLDTFTAFQEQLKSQTLMNLAKAIAILVAAILVLSLIDPGKMTASLAAIGGLFFELATAMKAISALGNTPKGMLQMSGFMVTISAAVLILAAAMKVISTMGIGEIAKSLVGILGLTAILVAAGKIMSSGTKKVIKGATQMVVMAAAMLILVNVCKKMSELNWEQLAKGIVGIGAVLLEFVGFQALMSLIKPKKMLQSATALVIIGAAMEIFADVTKKMGDVEWGALGKTGVAMAGILTIAAGFAVLSGMSKKMMSSSIALVIIGGAMEIFADVCNKFGQLKWEELGKAGAAIGGILALTAGFVLLSGLSKKMAGSVISLTIMAAAMEIFTDICQKFSIMKWEELGKAGAAIGGILVLAAGFALLSGLSGGMLGSAAALLVMATSLAILAPVLVSLGSMTGGEIAKSLIAIAGALTIIGVAGYVLGPIVPVILGLSAAIALFGVACAAVGAGVMLFSAGLSALAVSGAAGATALVAAIGVIITGLLGLVPAIIELLGDMFTAFGLAIAEAAPALGEAIKALVLTLVDILVECTPAIADGALKLLVGVMEALVEYGPQLIDLLFDFVIGILDGFAEKIPELVKSAVNLVASFFSSVIEALKAMDTTTLINAIAGVGLLSAFILALSLLAPLIPGAMLGVLGVGAIIAEIALVLAAIGALAQIPGLEWLINESGAFLQAIGNAIGGFVGGIIGGVMEGVTSSLPQIASDLSMFMLNLTPFIAGAKMVDSTMLEGVRSLAEIILILTGASILEGLTSWLTGGSSLTDFAKDLIPFGEAMSAFSGIVSGNINAEAITAAANAGKIIAEMASILPNTGGVASWFAGDNDMGAFFNQLVPFGKAMVGFSEAVDGKINESAVISAANAGKIIAEMASTLPNSGGVAGWFAGENDMTTFAKQLVPFGKAIADFSRAVDGKVNEGAVTAAANAGKMVAEMASALPNSGGLAGFFTGNNNMDTFGKQLVSFGKAMSDFAKSVSGVSSANVDLAVAQVNKLLSLIKGMSGIDFAVVASFENSLGDIGKSGVTAFTNAFKDCKVQVDTAAKTMMQYLVTGIKGSISTVSDAVDTLSNGMVSALKNKYTSFHSAGAHLAKGFANGISENSFRAAAQAKAMAEAAVEAAREALDINSPSKVFMALGKSIPEGFIKGIDKFSNGIDDSSITMARDAIDGTKNAIARVAELLNTDIDSQPTIRPVLDLSDVKSGASSINGLFGMQPSVDLLANVGSINTMMNGRQNVSTTNDDVVAAIKDLKHAINESSGDSYSIGDITYDDGSNIATTIQALIRASRIEGRI